MKTKDLNELKEMTGLTTEKELKVTVNPIAHKEPLKDGGKNALLVGAFVKYEGMYGIITGTHDPYVGFCGANEKISRACLVMPTSVEMLADPADKAKAHKSAKTYFEWERRELEARLKTNLSFNRPAIILPRLESVKQWLARL